MARRRYGDSGQRGGHLVQVGSGARDFTYDYDPQMTALGFRKGRQHREFEPARHTAWRVEHFKGRRWGCDHRS
jgi:hypothetical protein